MPPAYVHNLDDYWRWFLRQLDYSGGWLQHELLQVELIPDPREPVAIRIPKQRLLFHDRTYLDFHLLVNDQLELEIYSYHFAAADNEFIWRKDKHRGYPHFTHIHRPPDEDKHEPYEEVEIEEVIDQIREHFGNQAQG